MLDVGWLSVTREFNMVRLNWPIPEKQCRWGYLDRVVVILTSRVFITFFSKHGQMSLLLPTSRSLRCPSSTFCTFHHSPWLVDIDIFEVHLYCDSFWFPSHFLTSVFIRVLSCRGTLSLKTLLLGKFALAPEKNDTFSSTTNLHLKRQRKRKIFQNESTWVQVMWHESTCIRTNRTRVPVQGCSSTTAKSPDTKVSTLNLQAPWIPRNSLARSAV